MTISHTTLLQYLGKYVSFNTDSSFEMTGVISAIIFNIDGSVEFSMGWEDFFFFTEIQNLKIIGEVKLH